MRKFKIAVFSNSSSCVGRHGGELVHFITIKPIVYIERELVPHIPPYQTAIIRNFLNQVDEDWDYTKEGHNYMRFSQDKTDNLVSLLGENFESIQDEVVASQLYSQKEWIEIRDPYFNFHKSDYIADIKGEIIKQWINDINYPKIINLSLLNRMNNIQENYLERLKKQILFYYYPDVRIVVKLVNIKALLKLFKDYTQMYDSMWGKLNTSFVELYGRRELFSARTSRKFPNGIMMEDWYANLFEESDGIFVDKEMFLLDVSKLLKDKELEQNLIELGYVNRSI